MKIKATDFFLIPSLAESVNLDYCSLEIFVWFFYTMQRVL